MLHKSTFDFLRKLKKNNNREWFWANKKLYDDARYDFEVFIFELIQKLAEFDESVSGLEPKECMFRIYKDVRFSKDKTPYKTNFGAAINEGGRKMPYAGYYIHISPAECFIASGLYMPPPDKLLLVRNKIASKPNEFNKIVENNEFKKYFGRLWDGDTLKTVPKGFEKDHPMLKYLKLKSFIAEHMTSEEKALKKNYADTSAKVLKVLKPLNNFLNNL
ncbi:MAG: DUF2461 domain-containing protein [Ignavibacteria bacterium]|nr:DUF2461 domain-containing protein [Ignavibacteria bacterium]